MIPANTIVRPSSCLSTPKRRQGSVALSKADAILIQNAEIERMDRECWPRWKIAAVTGMSERQVYNRLAKIRETRAIVEGIIANAN